MTIPGNNISSLLHEDKSANHVTKGIDNPNPSHKSKYVSIMKDQWANTTHIQVINATYKYRPLTTLHNL